MSRYADPWVYVISAECGDYYCGCGLGHLLGIAMSRPDAERIREEGERAEHSYGDIWRRSFHSVEIQQVRTGVLRHREAQTWGSNDVQLRTAEPGVGA